jgi:phosphoglucosamine mutase
MAPAQFGTDGVRGVANEELTAELALALGRAAARVLPAPAFVVGRDTRRSGPLLQAAFSAGLASEGADVVDVGVLPTPGIAAVAEGRKIPGAVVSASHNPFGDNGIKLFSLRGTKLPTDVEAEIERELEAILADPSRPPRRPTGHAVGAISFDPTGAELYAAHLEAVAEGRRLDGLHIVVDCANGAASELAPRVLTELGARVTSLSCAPDGANINDHCGSTDPSALSLAVVEHQADLGLAFDGDADRAIAVDHTGTVVDGDVLLALFALDLAERDRLAGDTVAVTVMTNLGFRLAMEARGIAVRETDVGDRHVLAAVEADGLSLGGEQSGHIIFRSLSTTGDGILTGIALADLIMRAGRSLADLSAGLVERVPQRLVNVPIPEPQRLADCSEVWEAVVRAEAELGADGRVLLRPSGTEPIVRVMVEARVEAQANAVAAQLASVVEAALGQTDPPGEQRSTGSLGAPDVATPKQQGR